MPDALDMDPCASAASVQGFDARQEQAVDDPFCQDVCKLSMFCKSDNLVDSSTDHCFTTARELAFIEVDSIERTELPQGEASNEAVELSAAESSTSLCSLDNSLLPPVALSCGTRNSKDDVVAGGLAAKNRQVDGLSTISTCASFQIRVESSLGSYAGTSHGVQPGDATLPEAFSQDSQQAVASVVDECVYRETDDGTFPEMLQWSAQPMMADPSWTEPAPRDLDLSLSTKMLLNGSSSAFACDGNPCLLPKVFQAEGCMTGADRTPSPERHHDAMESSFDHKGRMLAHLIAENAKLHAELQAQSETSFRASDCCSPGPCHKLDSSHAAASGGVMADPLAVLSDAPHQAKVKSRKLSKKERERRQKRGVTIHEDLAADGVS